MHAATIEVPIQHRARVTRVSNILGSPVRCGPLRLFVTLQIRAGIGDVVVEQPQEVYSGGSGERGVELDLSRGRVAVVGFLIPVRHFLHHRAQGIGRYRPEHRHLRIIYAIRDGAAIGDGVHQMSDTLDRPRRAILGRHGYRLFIDPHHQGFELRRLRYGGLKVSLQRASRSCVSMRVCARLCLRRHPIRPGRAGTPRMRAERRYPHRTRWLNRPGAAVCPPWAHNGTHRCAVRLRGSEATMRAHILAAGKILGSGWGGCSASCRVSTCNGSSQSRASIDCNAPGCFCSMCAGFGRQASKGTRYQRAVPMPATISARIPAIGSFENWSCVAMGQSLGTVV